MSGQSAKKAENIGVHILYQDLIVKDLNKEITRLNSEVLELRSTVRSKDAEID